MWNRELVTDILNGNISEVCIYGTGLAAQMGSRALERLSVNCECFIDADDGKWGSILCGKRIKRLNQVSPEKQILIMANPEYKIHERLQQAGYHKWMYVDPEIFKEYKKGYFEQIHNKLKENSKKINSVYNMLADELSCITLEYILMHRMHHRLDLVEKVYEKNQYFGNDLIEKAGTNIIDCGAYTGDTLRRFMNKLEDDSSYQYYAFEAEKKNYDILLNSCKDIPNVHAYNIAVWDKQEELFFDNDDNTDKVSGRIIEIGDDSKKVAADSLDNVIGDKKIDMITMDIEGAEIGALNGAKKIIKKWHPCLAISAYHKLEHLWEIPILIKEMNNNYQIYFRHHRWNMDDTVCYGIIKNS